MASQRILVLLMLWACCPGLRESLWARSEDKACYQEQLARRKSILEADREKNGPVPYPEGYRVAFADKGETRKNTIKSQHLISGEDAVKLVADTPGLVIIDLRLPEEFSDEHLPGAINVPFIQPILYGFIRDLAKLDPAKPTLLYCDNGRETAKARLGFGVYGFLTNLYALDGGIRRWKQAGGETVGPKLGTKNALDRLPELTVPEYRPTEVATSAEKVSDGPFTTIPVSYDYDSAKDFAFDGHGNILARKITVYLRKNADVLGSPFHDIPDPRFPKERLLRTDRIRTIILDSHHSDEGIRYRADGTIVRGQQSGRGNPNGLWIMHDTRGVERRGGEKAFLVEGCGVQGIFTDTSNNIWFAGNQQGMSEFASLNFVGADNGHIELVKEGPLQSPWGVVHDSERGILFYSEPLARQIWMLPVDGKGVKSGEPEIVFEFAEAEPWGMTLDEYGNLYVATDPNVYRMRLDSEGKLMGGPVKINQEPIPRAHQVQFGNGPGFDETSLYIMSTPQFWYRVADPLTGYITGSYRPDGTVTRQVNNLPGYASPIVRLDLGVRGAANALIKTPNPPPDHTPLERDNRPEEAGAGNEG